MDILSWLRSSATLLSAAAILIVSMLVPLMLRVWQTRSFIRRPHAQGMVNASQVKVVLRCFEPVLGWTLS